MFYTWNFTLSAGKSEATKTKKEIILEKGTVTKCEVVFPVGCANLVFIHLNRALHQVYPKHPDYKFIGDGVTISCNDEYEIKEEPYQLEFYGWNTDEIYDHTITVRIQLVPAKEILHKVVGEVMRITKLRRPE
jgi:hypothetical protein